MKGRRKMKGRRRIKVNLLRQAIMVAQHELTQTNMPSLPLYIISQIDARQPIPIIEGLWRI